MAEEVHFWELEVVYLGPQLLALFDDMSLGPLKLLHLFMFLIPQVFEPHVPCLRRPLGPEC